MPPETEVAEQSATEAKTPSLGDKFRAEFAKIETPKEESPAPKPEVKAEPEAKVETGAVVTDTPPPPISKPSSPLDALLGKEKPAEKVEAPDVLKDFDPVKPDWVKARGVMKTQGERIKELDSEIATLKAAPKVDTNELEALKAEKAELNERIAKQETNLKAINAEYSEDFQSLLKEQSTKLKKIETRAKSYGVDPDILLSALALPEGKFKTQQIKDALAEVDSDDKADIRLEIKSLEDTADKISDFRKDLPAKWDELQTKRELNQREESEKNLKVLTIEFGKIVDNLPKNVVTLREVSEDVPGAAEWNAEVRASRETAFSAIKPNGADLDQTISLAVKGARYDSLEKRYLQLHSDYSEAMGRLKEFDGAGPDFKGGTKPKTEAELKPSQKYHKIHAQLQGAED